MFGKYNFEKQNVVLRYEPGSDLWATLAYKLPVEKSDFALLTLPNNIQRGVYINPNMNSGLTQINGGSCATSDWRNKLNLVKDGKKVVWRTNQQPHAWVQLDMRTAMRIVKVSINYCTNVSKFNSKVRFESGPIGAQNVQIRVRNDSDAGALFDSASIPFGSVTNAEQTRCNGVRPVKSGIVGSAPASIKIAIPWCQR